MVKRLSALVLFFLFIVASSSFGGEIIKKKGSKALFRMSEGESFSPGDILYVYSEEGERLGRMKVVKVKGRKGIGVLGRGEARDEAAPGTKIFAGAFEIQTSSDERSGVQTRASRKKKGSGYDYNAHLNIGPMVSGGTFLANFDFNMEDSLSAGLFAGMLSFEKDSGSPGGTTSVEHSGICFGGRGSYFMGEGVFGTGFFISGMIGYWIGDIEFVDPLAGATDPTYINTSGSVSSLYGSLYGGYLLSMGQVNFQVGAGLSYLATDTSFTDAETNYTVDVPGGGAGVFIDLSLGYSF